MRSENEAISKYTAAEILRNKRPWDHSRHREKNCVISIVANMDPAATVSSLHMCADTVEINKSSGPDTQLTETDQLREHGLFVHSHYNIYNWMKVLNVKRVSIRLCCHLVTECILPACFCSLNTAAICKTYIVFCFQSKFHFTQKKMAWLNRTWDSFKIVDACCI